MRQARILIVEDDPHMREGLTASIEKKGHKVEVACDALEAKLKLAGQGFDLVITDLRMPKGSGMDVLDCARDLQPATPVVVITAYGTVEKAVEAMKKGAVDFIQKPFSLTDLWETLDRCLGSRGAHGPDRAGSDPQVILTRNSQMLLILQRARAVAGTKVPVLLQGESGTGKELLARFIHRNSPRAHKPLVAVNCAAIPDNLLESELFGHEKGAFTGAISRKIGKFEQANGSTLLLDEIGEMSLNLQAKLLRVLQEWEVDRLGGNGPIAVDVRVIATTNADLLEGVRNGKFREDLYFRLSVMPLRLPPLRERKEDIPLLAEHFLKLACREHSRSIRGFTPRAMEKLEGHDWPGNVRELKNVIERAVLLASGDLVGEKDVWIEQLAGKEPEGIPGNGGRSLKDMERELILKTLEMEGWNRTRASAKLGISIRTLRNKLQEYRREGLIPAEGAR
jgi:two-component system response regulator FlrC